MTLRPGLSIDEVLPALRLALADGTRAVLQAPPGAGKTTRVPLALLGESWVGDKRIIMLEPRRLAARAAARFMASTLGESVGETVGYRVRGDSRIGPRTRIEVVTEGVLTRIIQDDPSLEGIAALLFDEFHERSLVADLGLALTLQSAELLRPDLRIVVMSATIDGASIAALLGGVPIITSVGHAFPVETIYVPRRDGVRLEGAMASMIERALDAHEGDILAFLPGAAELRRTAARLADRALPRGTFVYTLSGAMPLPEQDRAIAPSVPGERKVVLATAVAETSLTIEGVRVVIDSGLSRVPRFSPGSGMARLETVRVARDAADQRRGRAGRVAPGTCYRLWIEAEQAQLLARRTPEILEADLASLALELAAAGIAEPATLRWLDQPPTGTFAQARELLTALGALDTTARITNHGRQMAGMGLHPRLAHMVLRGSKMGYGFLAVDLAALLAERDVLRRESAVDDPDLRTRVEIIRARNGADDPRADRGRVFQIREESRRLRRELGVREPKDRDTDDIEMTGTLVALAYPDRVALSREHSRGRFILRNGRGARISDASALADCDALAIADTDGAPTESRVYLGAPINRATISEIFAEQIIREDRVAFDDATGRVNAVTRQRLGALVLDERAQHRPDPEAVAAAFADAIRRAGIAALPWSDGAQSIRRRLAFAHALDATWPSVSDITLLEEVHEWLAPHLTGMAKRSDLARINLGDLLLSRLNWQQRAALDALAPTHIAVPSGSRIAVDYHDPTAPILAVRLQEMFGAESTPTVGGGRVTVTLHLLSPAHRPVQVTKDLAGFWRTSYFDVRKDLRGRYPRHPWPEDPLSAPPTKRVKPSH